MTPIVVSDVLAVGEFPTAEQLGILAKAGFKSIINNQPDGEVERFPGSASIAADAKRVGLGHAYAPITTRTPSSDELAAMAKALETLPAPIYAFDYSGARAAAAAAFLLTAVMEPDAIVAEFGQCGFDVSALKPWLVEERIRRAPPKGTGNGEAANGAGGIGHAATPPPAQGQAANPNAAQAVQGIVVHARAAGFSGFAM